MFIFFLHLFHSYCYHFRWAQGYNGDKACYIDKDVICYLCGNNIKFVAEDGAETVFNFPGEGVGPFAVHPINRCFAVAEQCLNPKIYLFVYPTFRQMAVLEGGYDIINRYNICSYVLPLYLVYILHTCTSI